MSESQKKRIPPSPVNFLPRTWHAIIGKGRHLIRSGKHRGYDYGDLYRIDETNFFFSHEIFSIYNNIITDNYAAI